MTVVVHAVVHNTRFVHAVVHNIRFVVMLHFVHFRFILEESVRIILLRDPSLFARFFLFLSSCWISSVDALTKLKPQTTTPSPTRCPTMKTIYSSLVTTLMLSNAFHHADGAELLTAYVGAVNVPGFNFQGVSGCNPQSLLAEGMPVTFDVQVNEATLFADQFLIETENGNTFHPTCATLAPADDADEGYTVLLTGNFGNNRNLPVRVEVTPSQDGVLLESVNQEDLTGLETENVILGSEEGVSLVLAFWFEGTGPNGQDQIQTVWEGGVTAVGGAEFTEANLDGFVLVDSQGNSWTPTGFDDLNDGDNFVVLDVPLNLAWPIVRVEVLENTAYDPMNFPNPPTAVDVQSVSF